MIIGIDPHKRTHTCVAVRVGTGELVQERTARAQKEGFAQLLDWGRECLSERVWAMEDCRHVSTSFERFLIASGEKVVRVAPHMMAGARRGKVRQRGKSDSIDALAVARAALAEGVDNLPVACLDEQALEIKYLLDHRNNLVRSRTQDQNRLRAIVHELWPEFEIPSGALDRDKWLDSVRRRLGSKTTAQIRVAKDLLNDIRSQTKRIRKLEAEIRVLVEERAPQLLAEVGCGPISAAVFITEIANGDRFKTDAQLARLSGTAPIPVSSGNTNRHRLDRAGNRSLNRAFHQLAMTRARFDPETAAYVARKKSEGKSHRDALRSLKRYLARRIWKLLCSGAGIDKPMQIATL